MESENFHSPCAELTGSLQRGFIFNYKAQVIVSINKQCHVIEFGSFKSLSRSEKKKIWVVCLVSLSFCLFSSGRASRKDLSWAMPQAREPRRNNRLLPLKERVQAHKNPGDSFMLTSNPIHAGHEVMIESCFH
jgi:hypothetical protein